MYNRVKGFVGLREVREGPSSPQLYGPQAQPNTRPVGHNGLVPVGLHSSYSQRLAALDATSPKVLDTRANLEIIGQSPKRVNALISRPAILSQYQFAETSTASKILPYIAVNQKVMKKKPVVAIEKPVIGLEVADNPRQKALRALPKIQPNMETSELKPTTGATKLPLINITNKVSAATAFGDQHERKLERLRVVPAKKHLPHSSILGMANKPAYVPPSIPSKHLPPLMLGVTATCLVADQKNLPPVYNKRPYNLPPVDMNESGHTRYENTGELRHPVSTGKHAISATVKRAKKNGARRR